MTDLYYISNEVRQYFILLDFLSVITDFFLHAALFVLQSQGLRPHDLSGIRREHTQKLYKIAHLDIVLDESYSGDNVVRVQ
jgi:hypothetical protein